MSYIFDKSRADISVAIHPFTGRASSGNTNLLTYSTPTNLGEGVTRPSSTSFTLAAGRSYLLFGGACVYRNGSPTGAHQFRYQFYNTTALTYIGKKGGIRNAYGSTMTLRNPMYRQEAVAFIHHSDITGASINVQLIRTIEVGNDTGYNYATTGWSDPAVVIMSIPA